jgi:dihydrodipicolinate synthase/N-acetylneuraminate lyase
MPAIITPFDSKLAVDHAFLAQHATWLLDNGCTGLVMLGSLGEGATLEHAEKIAVLKTAVQVSSRKKTPVVAAIPALSTSHAVELAREAEQAGCDGLMVLPPYVYTSDWREMKHHVAAVNDGAQGWVAGLVNAFPAESVELFNLARAGRHQEAFALYRWFLPLLRMDTVPKFVQLIKWVQGETGTGSATVRAPRQELHGAELTEAQQVFKTALANRPAIHSTPFPSLQEA